MSDFDNDLVSQPHDAFFKDFFSDLGQATGFFQGHLPQEMAACVRWDSLDLVPGSFVKRSLQQAHSDLLFSAQTKGDRKALLYLLFEHQTSVDPAMPLRLLAYQVEILLAHFNKHGLPLPLIVCYVLHQGPDRWTVSTAFEDLFQLSESETSVFEEYLPRFRHVLLDLTQIDPDVPENEAPLRVVLQLMKLARERQLLTFFEWLMKHFEDWAHQLSGPFLRKTVLYALHSDSDLDVESIAHTLTEAPELRETIMSVAEKLIAKGRAEGLAEGRAEGLAEGRAEGETRGALIGNVRLWEKMMGLDVTSEKVFEKLGVEELEELLRKLEERYEAEFGR